MGLKLFKFHTFPLGVTPEEEEEEVILVKVMKENGKNSCSPLIDEEVEEGRL